jgi:hypothetical protein
MLAFPADVAGKVIRCPKCQKTIRVNAAPHRPAAASANQFDLGPGDFVRRRSRRRRRLMPRIILGTLVLLVLAGGAFAAWWGLWRENATDKIVQAMPSKATPPLPARTVPPSSAAANVPPTMATPPSSVVPKSDPVTTSPKKEAVAPAPPPSPKEQPKPAPVKEPPPTPPVARDNSHLPHLVVRFHSAKAVVDAAEKLAESIGQESRLEEILQNLKDEAGKETLPGVDQQKPLGLYLRLGDNGTQPEIVGLVPVSDRPKFLNLVKSLIASLGGQFEDGDQGSYLLQYPSVGTVALRFAHEHACFALTDHDAVGEEKLQKPAEVFAGTQAVLAAATLHIERIPKKQRAQVRPQIENVAQTAWQLLSIFLPKNKRTTNRAVLKLLSQGTAELLAEGKALSVDLGLDQAKQKLALDVRLSAGDNSGLKATFVSFGKSPSAFANLLTADCALSALVHANLPAALRKELSGMVRSLAGSSGPNVKENEKRQADALVKVLEPTVAAGELDAGMVIRTAGPNQPATILGGVKIVDALAVEKWLKEAVPSWSPESQSLFQFDQDLIGKTHVHGLHLPVPPAGPIFQLLGNEPGLLAFRKDAALFCLGRKSEDMLKKAVESPAGPAPVFHLQVNLKRIIELIPVEKELAEELFTDANPGRLEINLRGGETVKLRLELDLNFLQFIAEQQLFRFQYKQAAFLEPTRSVMSSASAPALPEGAKVKLSVTQGLRVGKNYALKEGVTYVGRKGQHTVDVDLTEQECPGKTVAVNRFALIWLDKNGLAIADTGRRVTKINGTLVPSGKRILLKADDTLQFGKTALQVKVIAKKRTAAQK